MNFNQKTSIRMDGLETRLLMHGGPGGPGLLGGGPGGHGGGGGCGGGGGELGIFLPASPNATVQADETKLQTDLTTLRTDVKALSTTDKATLKTDETAIRTAVKAISTTLTPLQTTLKTDLQTWSSTIFADQKKIRLDTRAGTDTTADQAQLKADQLAGLTAITADK